MALHTCTVCKVVAEWDEDMWEFWGSYMMVDDGLPVLKTCSPVCRKAIEIMGGPKNVLSMVWNVKGVTPGNVPRENRKYYKDLLGRL